MHRDLVLGGRNRVRLAAPIVRLAALAAAWCVAAAPRPAAAEMLYQTGFETSEGFVAGQALVGQGGFVARLGLNADAATVVAENPATGSQAVRIDGALLTNLSPTGFFSGAYAPLLNDDPLAHGTPIIEESVDSWPSGWGPWV